MLFWHPSHECIYWMIFPLKENFRANGGLPVNELLAVIQASVQEFSGVTQADDITLIVARCR